MASSETVVLKGGVVVSVAALRLGWSLEDRGFSMRPIADKLEVQPHERLTREDVKLIRAHRDELLQLVNYEAPEVQ